ncbi:hypothetical protein OHS70_02530 [Streptomyces sp. NBC_00390]
MSAPSRTGPQGDELFIFPIDFAPEGVGTTVRCAVRDTEQGYAEGG